MRTDDLALPALDPHDLPSTSPMVWWPGQVRIALEYLPQGVYAWDDPDPDVTWDHPSDRYVWDDTAIGSGFVDVVCDFHALELEPGEPDELGLIGPVQATLTLDNRAGRYTAWGSDGRLVLAAPGRRLAVWVDVAGEAFWLFQGRITAWTGNTDRTVTIEAFDGLALLAQDEGRWTPGTTGQTALARIQAVAAQTGYTDPVRGDAGDLPLATEPGDDTPLDACHRAALSDGGTFYADADGALIYRDRLWRAGRDDQTEVVGFSDNVCPQVPGWPFVVWDAEQAGDDFGLATTVTLDNLAGIQVSAALPAGAPGYWWNGIEYRLTHPAADLWQTAPEGQTLADYLLDQHSTPVMAVRAFGLYLTAPQVADPALWTRLVNLRRGDRFEWVSDYLDRTGTPGRVDVALIITGIGHNITPDGWVMRVTGSRTVEAFPVQEWDETAFTWDQVDPANVWRY